MSEEYLPQKKSNKIQPLQNAPARNSGPEWDDLTDDQKLIYGSPMKYARHKLDAMVDAAQNGESDENPN